MASKRVVRWASVCVLGVLSGVACSRKYASAPEATMPAPAEFAVQEGAEAMDAEHDTEAYDHVAENEYRDAARQPLSTFSVDVDTASYSNVRRFLNEGQLPPAGAVRIEELLNYFSYAYPEPTGDAPFSVSLEVSAAPWNTEHRLVHVGLKGKSIAAGELPPRNLVFLLDVSGSMADANKLPLLRRSMKELLATLGERDRVAIVVYAGASGVVLPPTSAGQHARIEAALDGLEAGGSTNGGQGIELAYRLAEEHRTPGSVNRVILATDGDFNVGVTSQSELLRLIEKKRERGVELTVLGFGMGNYKDSTLEKLADAGNGNYAYIDDIAEARKVLVREAGATLVTIAKDVKIQVEFNPAEVSAYRLIGYENRVLQDRDFNDDKKDAGDIGAGHTVTALYEIVPKGAPAPEAGVDALKYQKPSEKSAAAASGELATVKLRYKAPQGSESSLITHSLVDRGVGLEASSESFRFSAAVAAFGMLLRGSQHKGLANYAFVRSLAEGARGADQGGYRSEFLGLVAKAERLAGPSLAAPLVKR